jgi:hypothetical protein
MVARFLIAAALVIAPAVVLATPASAVTPLCGKTDQCTITYFNNADHTKVVGYRITNCEDQVTSSGKTSDYVSLQLTACPPGGE